MHALDTLNLQRRSALAAALALLALGGCSGPARPALRIGTNVWIGGEPTFTRADSVAPAWLHAATGEPECRAAAQRWLDDALARRQPGTGVGGYRHPRGRDPGAREHAGFLEGASGIGLALLAMIDDTEPAWDRLLLLS